MGAFQPGHAHLRKGRFRADQQWPRRRKVGAQPPMSSHRLTSAILNGQPKSSQATSHQLRSFIWTPFRRPLCALPSETGVIRVRFTSIKFDADQGWHRYGGDVFSGGR